MSTSKHHAERRRPLPVSQSDARLHADEHPEVSISKQILNRLHALQDNANHGITKVKISRIAEKIMNCDDRKPREDGHQWDPCGHPLHARCAARIAKYNRRAAERAIRELPRDVKLAHVTLTTGADTITEGHEVITTSFAALRRLAAWRRAVSGGFGQIEVLPAIGGSRPWNIHAHVLVTLTTSDRSDVSAITAGWRALLAERDKPGSVTWSPVTRRFVRGHADATFRTGRVLRDETKAQRVAQRDRRAAPRHRARGARQAMGAALRDVPTSARSDARGIRR